MLVKYFFAIAGGVCYNPLENTFCEDTAMDRYFFTANRAALMNKIEGDCVLVSFSGLPKRRSADDDYPFTANRDFVYLTGVEYKDIIYLAVRKNGELSETLYIPPVDALTERWHGRMLHESDVEEISGIKNYKYRNDFMPDLWLALNACSKLYLDLDPAEPWQDKELPQQFAERIKAERSSVEICDYFPIMQMLRSIKAPEELENLNKAIEITAQGIAQVLKTARPGIYEYNIRAEFEKVLADNGVHTPAFATIVGAGRNSLCLHYNEEDCLVQDGDLVQLDLGAQYGLECADISRVFPANGRFTPQQRSIAKLCADTVDYVCSKARPGMHIKDLNALQDAYLLTPLKALGLAETAEDIKKYRWHSISHHLGMDTHDSCGRDAAILPGSVCTLEVGVYIEEWGFGVRIEDDMLMTESGGVNLSKNLIPRTPDEIEKAMGK